jgi:UDP-GlcNAc3NAcA epimerase
LLCPSQLAVDNLAAEGVRDGVALVGDVRADVLRQASAAAARSGVLARLGLTERECVVATVHRANTDDAARLERILNALAGAPVPVVFPLHPRTRTRLAAGNVSYTPPGATGSLRPIDPVGYVDKVKLVGSPRVLFTDSGGLQKEAYWLSVPCVTLRDRTEWSETVAAGWNRVADADPGKIVLAFESFAPPCEKPTLYGDGRAAERIVAELEERA